MLATASKQIVFILLTSAAVLTACSGCPDAPLGASGQGSAYISPSVKWPGNDVAACWEKLADSTAEDRATVQQIVATEISARAAIELSGWTECPAADFAGLRIAVMDVAPETSGVGRNLSGVDGGLRINTKFAAWGHDCAISEGARQKCLRATVVHEFLHALGFSHEQNRPDTPASCHEPSQGSDAEVAYGQWDAHSAMNYCNDIWNNDGHLSPEDAAALQYLYGALGTRNRPEVAVTTAHPAHRAPSKESNVAASCSI